MSIPVNRHWELAIDPETVRLFAQKARAVSADMRDDYKAGGEHEVELDHQSRDAHLHDGLQEEESEDLTARELRALMNDLNVDEAADLIALMLIGRGDFEASEWDDALAEARSRNLRRASRYLMGMPMLGDWLEEGLEAMGIGAGS